MNDSVLEVELLIERAKQKLSPERRAYVNGLCVGVGLGDKWMANFVREWTKLNDGDSQALLDLAVLEAAMSAGMYGDRSTLIAEALQVDNGEKTSDISEMLLQYAKKAASTSEEAVELITSRRSKGGTNEEN